MAQPYIGELRMFAGNFAPDGWLFCEGQILPISEYDTLFSLLGTTYGGDGKSTFALPDLKGCVPVHPLNNQYFLGQMGGSETVTLLQSEMPVHSHALTATVEDGTQGTFQNGVTLATSIGGQLYQTNTGGSIVSMNPVSLAPAGGSLPHNNLMPYLTLYFNIALQGVFPPRG